MGCHKFLGITITYASRTVSGCQHDILISMVWSSMINVWWPSKSPREIQKTFKKHRWYDNYLWHHDIMPMNPSIINWHHEYMMDPLDILWLNIISCFLFPMCSGYYYQIIKINGLFLLTQHISASFSCGFFNAAVGCWAPCPPRLSPKA